MKKSSQGRLPRDDDDGDGGGGLRLGLGGFCLRHCAISSQWLNRSFASSPFSPLSLALSSSYRVSLRAPLLAPGLRLTRYSLYLSSFRAATPVLGLSPVTYAWKLSFRVLSRFVPMPRYFCVFLPAARSSPFDTRESGNEKCKVGAIYAA